MNIVQVEALGCWNEYGGHIQRGNPESQPGADPAAGLGGGECGVSVGSIYNYYGSKADLVGAAVESVWHEIFHRPEDDAVFRDTLACLVWMYRQMAAGCKDYPGFFTLHSLGFLGEDKAEGKQRMEQTWQHILDALCAVLRADPKVRPGAFTPAFTPEQFAGVLFSLMLSALLRQDYDPGPVLEIVRRTLY